MASSSKQTVRLVVDCEECQSAYSSRMTTTTREYFQGFGAGHLPGHLGVEILTVEPRLVASRLAVTRQVMAPNGYLYAAAVARAAYDHRAEGEFSPHGAMARSSAARRRCTLAALR